LVMYGVIGTPGNPYNPPYAANARGGTALPSAVIGAARAADVDQSRAGPAVPDSSDDSSFSPTGGATDAATFGDLGTQHATAYLTAFSSTIKDSTGPDLVQAFTDGVNRQLSGSSGAGDILAQRLATFIDNRTRQAIADALANMDLTANGSSNQAGGPGHQAFTPH